MSLVLAIDPGLAKGGWAVFAAPAQRLSTLNGYGPCLVGSGSFKTEPDTRPDHIGIPARADLIIDQLAAQLGRLDRLRDEWPATAVIETPAIFGPYSRKGSDRPKLALGMADSMAMLWYVIGRLDTWIGMNGTRVVRVKASGGKSDHHRTVQVIWPHLPTTKTGPAEDQRDAVWLGLRYLTDARRAG